MVSAKCSFFLEWERGHLVIQPPILLLFGECDVDCVRAVGALETWSILEFEAGEGYEWACIELHLYFGTWMCVFVTVIACVESALRVGTCGSPF